MALGTPYLIGTEADGAGAATCVVAVGKSTVAGDAVIVTASVNTTGLSNVASVADSQGNAYVLAEGSNNDSTGIPESVFVALDTIPLTSGTDTITVTFTGTSPGTGNKNAIAIGCSGVAAAAAVDQTNLSLAVTQDPSVTSGPLGSASELCIGACSNQSGGGLLTWDSPWAVLGTAAAAQRTSVATQEVSSTSAVTASGELTSSVHGTIIIVTLKAAGAPPPPSGITLVNDFASGTPGQAVTVASTAGPGQHELDAVFNNSGASTVEYDDTFTVHGAPMVLLATVTSGLADLRWAASMGTQDGPVYARAYAEADQWPAALTRLISYQTAADANCATAHLNTDGTINIRDSTGSPVLTSITKVPAGKLWRLEIFVLGDASAGQCGFRLFTGNPDATLPTEQQVSAATQAFSGPPGLYDFGLSTAVANGGPVRLGGIALSNVTWPGPLPGGGGASWPFDAVTDLIIRGMR